MYNMALTVGCTRFQDLLKRVVGIEGNDFHGPAQGSDFESESLASPGNDIHCFPDTPEDTPEGGNQTPAKATVKGQTKTKKNRHIRTTRRTSATFPGHFGHFPRQMSRISFDNVPS